MKTKFCRNEKGITLVELLAVLAISSLIVISIVSIHIFIQKQYESQSTNIHRLTDITIAAKAITKDIRSASEVNATEHMLNINDSEIIYTYNQEENVLKKNGTPYIHNIDRFIVEQQDSKITLEITNESGKSIKTIIMIREGDKHNDQTEE